MRPMIIRVPNDYTSNRNDDIVRAFCAYAALS
jgi:hypothetical protein